MQRRDPAWPEMDDTAVTGTHVAGLRIAAYGIGFVASIVIARALGPGGRGQYALPIAILGVAVALSHVGLEQANVFLSAKGSPSNVLWANATITALVAGVATWLVAAVAVIVVGHGALGGLPLAWGVVAVVQVPFLLQVLYWSGLLQLEGRLRSASMATLAGVGVHLGIVLIFWVLGDLTPFRVLVLSCVTNGVTWAILLALSSRAGLVGLTVDLSTIRRATAYGLKAYAGSIFVFLILRLDQVLVRHYLDFRALGLYSLAVAMAEVLWLLSDPFSMSVVPHQVRAEDRDARRLTFATARMTLLIAALSATFAWFAAPAAIHAVYGAAFSDAVWPFRLLLPGIVALAVDRPLSTLLIAEGQVTRVTLAGAVAFVANVLANVVLLSRVGIVGASIASSISYFLLTLVVARGVGRPAEGWVRSFLPRVEDVRRLARGLAGRSGRVRRSGPLRVILVIGTLERGGTEGQVVLLASALASRGVEVTIICLQHAGALAGGLEGVKLVEAGLSPLTIWDYVPVPGLRLVLRVRNLIKAEEPDVVHSFLYWGNLLGIVAGRLARTPVVIGSVRSLRSAANPRALLIPWEWTAIRWADAIVCNSEAVASDTRATMRVPSTKLRVIVNGVAAPATTTAPRAGQPIRILVVANLIAYKGHATLLHAFALALGASTKPDMVLELAGAGPEEASLRALSKELGIVDRVAFLGSVSDAGALFERSSFTVLPSLSEGMPNAVLESLAYGRAVIGSDVGGVSEILGEAGGILVPPGDVRALADAISFLSSDLAYAGELAAGGRHLVLERFRLENMVEHTRDLYEELLTADGERGAGAIAP